MNKILCLIFSRLSAIIMLLIILIIIPVFLFVPIIIDSSYSNTLINEKFQENINDKYKYIEDSCRGIENNLITQEKLNNISKNPAWLIRENLHCISYFPYTLLLVSEKNPTLISYLARVKGDSLFIWSDKLIGISAIDAKINFETLSRFLLFASIAIIELILIVSFIICYSCGEEKVKSRNFFLGILFCLSLFSSLLILIFAITYDKNIKINSKSGELIRKESLNILNKKSGITDNSASTGVIVNIPAEIQKLGISKGFIGKNPIFSIEHIRFDINPFEYIIFTEGDPEILNPKMSYQKICDNVWIGKYFDHDLFRHMNNWASYGILIFIWGSFLLSAYLSTHVIGVVKTPAID